ncbi:unnamed protein product, partial [Ceratitis capitata]
MQHVVSTQKDTNSMQLRTQQLKTCNVEISSKENNASPERSHSKQNDHVVIEVRNVSSIHAEHILRGPKTDSNAFLSQHGYAPASVQQATLVNKYKYESKSKSCKHNRLLSDILFDLDSIS